MVSKEKSLYREQRGARTQRGKAEHSHNSWDLGIRYHFHLRYLDQAVIHVSGFFTISSYFFN
jgi:hypothetical protein